MNSSKAFDDVILYLEKIIIDGCEIDNNEISKITMSPAALFQRIFIFVSGISISDYVRKRRLTLAGHELKNNDISVLNAAIKYGFQSHSSFTRAFKEHHGITPSEAKVKSTKLNDYLPINFSEMRFNRRKTYNGRNEKDYLQRNGRTLNGWYVPRNLFFKSR